MKDKIILIGGSFNPPTKAHLELAKLTREQLKAKYVILIPSKTDYLKSWKHYSNENIFDDNIRLSLLKTLECDWLKIDTCEIEEKVSGKTYDTIQYIKQKYQNSDIYFAIGSDKLFEITSWYNSNKLLSEEKFIVVQRNHDDMESIINNDMILKNHKNNFMLYNLKNEKFQNYSSTMVRKYLSSKNLENKMKAKEMVPECVWNELLKYTIINDIK